MAPEPRQVREVHRRLLERWRRAMDLVGPGPVEPHLDDAETAVRLLSPTGRWADLGSGAGFPGVALAAWHPDLAVTLVESREKRALFLGQVVREAGLGNVTLFRGRVEDLPAAAYDGVVARAFAPPEAVLAHAARLLGPGGRAVLFMAREEPPHPEEWVLEDRLPYTVGNRARFLAVYRR